MMRSARAVCRWFLFCLLLIVFSATSAWAGIYQHGTVVRMRMAECLPAHHGFMVAFGTPANQTGAEQCPEYTLVSDKVVFVIVGRSSDQLVPLADVIDFRIHNGELAVRVDDASREAKFGIKEMVLRSEWDLVQKRMTEELSNPHPTESSLAMRTRQ